MWAIRIIDGEKRSEDGRRKTEVRRQTSVFGSPTSDLSLQISDFKARALILEP